MVSLFVTLALKGEHVAAGWSDSAYKVQYSARYSYFLIPVKYKIGYPINYN